jgi:hypothetical protein
MLIRRQAIPSNLGSERQLHILSVSCTFYWGLPNRIGCQLADRNCDHAHISRLGAWA